MASFSHTVTVPGRPEEVFPWLFEAHLVPRWTSGLRDYEPPSEPRTGARVRQRLDVSGQNIDVDMEITRYDPPHAAETQFTSNGVQVVNVYELAPDGPAGTRLTQSLDARAKGMAARFLLPVVQPRLEHKLTEDLERLRGVLAGAA
jgi:uncharacterized protein YndB with AHSA1/START domain